ncbi:MAG: hypothetical protein ACYC4P_14435 [Thermoanaerobaculia bacterium]
MIAFKRTVTVEDPERLVLSGLPLRKGQRVEIFVLAEEALVSRPNLRLRALLKSTQQAVARRRVTEKQIADEIRALRAGR